MHPKWSGIVEATGIARTRLDSDSAGATSIRLVLADDEAARIGVDTDAELQSLIQIEQAYSANIQVIQAASRMLSELTEIR